MRPDTIRIDSGVRRNDAAGAAATTGTTVRSVERRAISSLAVLVLFIAALGALVVAWATVRTSSAAFGDQEILDRNHLGAGTVDIALGSASVEFGVADMAPGDVEAGRLELTNEGTLPLRYNLTAATSGGPLADVMEVALWMRVGTVCADREPPSGVTAWTRSNALSTVGDATPRRLAPGESDVLCMLGRLPLSAPTSVQGQVLELSVIVAAEHDVEASR